MEKINLNFKMLISLGLLAGLVSCGETRSIPSTGTAQEQVNTGSPLNVRVSSPDADAAEPAIGTDGKGNIYIVYVEHGAGKSADVFLQKFDGALKPLGGKVRVNAQAGEATAWRGDQPTVKADTDGKVYVGWTAGVKTAEGPANNLLLSVSTDGGQSFAAPVKINDDSAPASHGMHAMAVDNEKVYFAWLDERYLKKEPLKPMPENKKHTDGATAHDHAEPNAELYFAVSKDGGKTFAENKRLAGDICPCCKVSLLTAKDGELYLSWRQVLSGDLRHIAIAASADHGETFNQPAVVSDDKWQINACPVSGASLTAGKDGTLKTAWYTAGEAGAPGLYWAESKDQGRTFSPRTLLSEGAVFGTPVMLSDDKGNYRVIWTANGRVLTQAVTEQKPRDIGEGELPAAAFMENRLYTGYIKNENGRRSIWLNCIGTF